jgi:hypothetical protein
MVVIAIFLSQSVRGNQVYDPVNRTNQISLGYFAATSAPVMRIAFKLGIATRQAMNTADPNNIRLVCFWAESSR